jgi:hypothetical protein
MSDRASNFAIAALMLLALAAVFAGPIAEALRGRAQDCGCPCPCKTIAPLAAEKEPRP